MDAFKTFTGVICAIDRANIDTDALIPKEHLKSIKRTGFGPGLFADWRYTADGGDNPQFVMNLPKTKGASILVGRSNFGCGSSREHAVWAVAQQGFRVVIAPIDGELPAFADIFRNNCVKNGVLTVQLAVDEVNWIFKMASKDEPLEATVDLEAQTVTFSDAQFHFEMDSAAKDKLLSGMDDISASLQFESDITAFEVGHDVQLDAALQRV